jgi:hypothetical protein
MSGKDFYLPSAIRALMNHVEEHVKKQLQMPTVAGC